jgi:uncharacterized membrane protein (DUF106 family)
MTITGIMQMYPIYSLIVVSIFVTLVSTLAHKWLTNQEHMKNMKKRQKELQKELKACKDDECRMKEIQVEMMKITGKMMKSSFKPMFVTIIPFLILFAWLRGTYTEIMGSTWIWYYLGFSVVSSMILRKVFKVA